MQSQDTSQLATRLAHRVGNGEDAGQIAEAMVSTWQDIDTALTPVIGQRGVAMLYKRSLYLISATHPWLQGTHEGVHAAMDLEALDAAFAQQSAAAAAAAAGAMLRTFHSLLVSLVGPSLTERLLRTLWVNSSSGLPAQDASP